MIKSKKEEEKNIFFKKSKSSHIKENSKTDNNISYFYSRYYSCLNYNPNLFLDYAFKGNKKKLYINDNHINLIKAEKYSYELEQTFKLNIDALLAYYNNSNNIENNNNNINNNKEILLLLSNIREKEKYKREGKIQLKKKCNELISKNDYVNNYHKKINNQLNQYNIKIENKIKEIKESNNYISYIKKKFYGVEKYINKLRFNSEGKRGIEKKNKLKRFIRSNNKYLLNISNYNKNIKKLKENISEIKKDNKLLRSQNKLYKWDKPDINLIRVVEFYIRIIRNISLKNKILKNSIYSLSKTLDFLDLNLISNFNEYKRNRQKSSYEIEFSDLENNNDENKIINNYHKSKTFMDFNKILK